MTREQQFGTHTRRFIIKRKTRYMTVCSIAVYLYKKYIFWTTNMTMRVIYYERVGFMTDMAMRKEKIVVIEKVMVLVLNKRIFIHYYHSFSQIKVLANWDTHIHHRVRSPTTYARTSLFRSSLSFLSHV